MRKNNLLEQVRKIEEIELKLTIFNAKRALSKTDKKLEVKKIGDCSLLLDTHSPGSIYYNRVKGFGGRDLDKLKQILDVYGEHNIAPSFDMTPDHINEEVAVGLSSHGYVNVQQLAFMQLTPQLQDHSNGDIKIVKVTDKNAEEFVNIIISSQGGMDISNEVIQKKKQYFHQDNFHNYIAYIDDEVAGMGSLFICGDEGYIANDFTFEKFRGRGVQTALLKHRIHIAKELDLEKLYTDVEFATISHNNMEKLGFSTVFINSFYMKR